MRVVASLCCIKLIKGRKFLGGILNLSKTEKKHPPAIYFPFLELSLLLNNHLLKMDIFSVFTRYPSFLAFLSSFSLMLCLHLITRSYVFIKFTYWRVTDGKRIPLRIKSILSETVDLPKSRTFSMTFAKRTWFFAVSNTVWRIHLVYSSYSNPTYNFICIYLLSSTIMECICSQMIKSKQKCFREHRDVKRQSPPSVQYYMRVFSLFFCKFSCS